MSRQRKRSVLKNKYLILINEMDRLLILSLIESLYLIYMFHIFKTSVDFNFLPLGILGRNNEWFRHIVGNEYGLRICPFGRVMILFLIALIIARNFVAISPYVMNTAFILSVLLSMMNMNAVVYMIPVWLLELSQ
jgi:hypothetical protein